MTINKEAFLAVADVIEYADRFDLTYFAMAPDGQVCSTTPVWEDCGTTACIAGWVNAWADNDSPSDTYGAGKELGITPEEGYRLFYGYNGSVWSRHAREYGWRLDRSGRVSDWSDITAIQAADVLRRIANGDITL